MAGGFGAGSRLRGRRRAAALDHRGATPTGSSSRVVAERRREAREPPGGHPWDYVAGTRVGKSYVSYYLMPVYGMPELLDGVSPELKRRMQGKACFNFTRIDEALFSELATLTATGIERYRHFQPPERR